MSGVSSSPSPPILSSSSSSSSKAEYLPLTIINTTNQRSHTPHTPHSDAFASSSSSSQPPVRAADRPDTSLSRSPSRHSQTRHSPSLSIQTQHLVADQDDTSNSFKMGREYYTEDDASKPLKGDVSPISYSSIEDEASSELSITELARKPNESLYIKKCALVNQEIDRMGMVGLDSTQSCFVCADTSMTGQIPMAYLESLRSWYLNPVLPPSRVALSKY